MYWFIFNNEIIPTKGLLTDPLHAYKLASKVHNRTLHWEIIYFLVSLKIFLKLSSQSHDCHINCWSEVMRVDSRDKEWPMKKSTG